VCALLVVDIGTDNLAFDRGWRDMDGAAANGPMISRWSSAPKCPHVFFSAEKAVMPEQV
jgi:hypothetical protein